MPLTINELDRFIGDKIKSCREKVNWPLKTLADQLHISIQHLQRYEQGVSKVPASLLFELAHTFHITPAHFFEGYPPEPHEDEKNISYNILLIEDDPNDEFLVRNALIDFPEPLNIYTIHDGRLALSFFRRLSKGEPTQLPMPDLIFMDLSLPYIRGLELLEDVKRRRGLQNIPVIVLTNSLNSTVITEAYHLQASGFIRKSFVFSEFQEQLHEALSYWTKTVILPSKAGV